MDEGEFQKLADEHEALIKQGFSTGLKRRGRLGFNHHGYLEIKNQAKFNPIKFLNGLVAAADRDGVQFYQNTTETQSQSALRADCHVRPAQQPKGNSP
jgi:glycine/D-amino acid oxidase-like deaminating enzyme